MSNKNNGFSLCHKLLHYFHKLLDLLRSQYCGRLVKNQNIIVTVQHFKDFNSLLHSYGNIRDVGIRINFKFVLFTEFHYFFSGVFHFQNTHFYGFPAKHNTFQNCKIMNQFKMLMNHSDAQLIRIVWIIDLYSFSIDLYFAFLRLIKTKKNTHQGGLSCSVFPKKSVDFSFFYLESNVIVCFKIPKLFCNMVHFDYIFHSCTSFTRSCLCKISFCFIYYTSFLCNKKRTHVLFFIIKQIFLITKYFFVHFYAYFRFSSVIKYTIDTKKSESGLFCIFF